MHMTHVLSFLLIIYLAWWNRAAMCSCTDCLLHNSRGHSLHKCSVDLGKSLYSKPRDLFFLGGENLQFTEE
jgi:hypothetical protein